MEEMNKEELIEYFLELVNDNRYLGKLISVDQIKEKLHRNIKSIEHNSVNIPQNAIGNCGTDITDGTITIGFKKDEIPDWGRAFIFFHEMLHALSSSVIAEKDKHYLKGGFEFVYAHEENGMIIHDKAKNRALNEGMTQALVERSMKSLSAGVYDDVKDIVKVMAVIIGQNAMVKKYFANITDDDLNTRYLFMHELENKYGKEIALEFSESLARISVMSDKLLELEELEKFDDPKTKALKEKIYGILESMLSKTIEIAPNTKTKINDIMIPLFSTSLGEKYSPKLIEEFWQDESIGSDEKKDIAYSIINKYLENAPYSQKKISRKFLVGLYTRSGIVSQNEWDKCNALADLINGTILREAVNKIENVKYQQVGDYYMILGDYKTQGDNHELLNGVLFDKEGNRVEIDKETFNKMHKRKSKKIY